MTYESATDFLDILYVGLCLFCANLLLLRRQDQGVYLPLALLFLIQGIARLAVLSMDAQSSPGLITPMLRVGIVVSALEVFSPFLFWLYVRGLTSEGDVARIPKLSRHLVPLGIVWVLAMSVALMPSSLNEADISEDNPALIGILLVGLVIVLVDILVKIIIAVYLFLTIRRLRAYQKRLRDVFASTENRELTWIWAITVTGGVFWCFNVLISITAWYEAFGLQSQFGLAGFFESLALLALFWVIGIWGLRQRPGLLRAPVTDPPDPDGPAVKKYEKSALDDQRAARIAAKIESAMESDQLYREPNLSLWDLAKHIGVTSHYVSQTLNTHLSSSFFDYINRWRIKDAVAQLNTTEETILVIAYDVGFNSRSAFYKAFKRETGKTPSDLRK